MSATCSWFSSMRAVKDIGAKLFSTDMIDPLWVSPSTALPIACNAEPCTASMNARRNRERA